MLAMVQHIVRQQAADLGPRPASVHNTCGRVVLLKSLLRIRLGLGLLLHRMPIRDHPPMRQVAVQAMVQHIVRQQAADLGPRPASAHTTCGRVVFCAHAMRRLW